MTSNHFPKVRQSPQALRHDSAKSGKLLFLLLRGVGLVPQKARLKSGEAFILPIPAQGKV